MITELNLYIVLAMAAFLLLVSVRLGISLSQLT